MGFQPEAGAGVSEDMGTLPVPRELPGPGYGAFHCVWNANEEEVQGEG